MRRPPSRSADRRSAACRAIAREAGPSPALLIAATALLFALALLLALPARAGEAEDAVEAWVAALTSGDDARIAATLAPEFQVQRADGAGYTKAEYLAGGLPRLSTAPKITDLVETRDGDVMVVRYALDIGGTLDGKAIAGRAPRLTVFRKAGDTWLVVAHANFAPVVQ